MLWIVAFAGVTMASSAAGGAKFSSSFSLPGTESTKALDLMKEAFPKQSGESASIVWKASSSVRDADVERTMSDLLKKAAKLPKVGQVASPYTPHGAAQISENGKIAYAQITFTQSFDKLVVDDVKPLVDAAKAARGDGLQVELGGNVITLADAAPANISEIVGVIAAAIVLYLAFGSFLAMLLPIVTAIFSVGLGMNGIALFTHTADVPSFASMLGMLIGLGVGIDYALFIVTRYRTGIRDGLTPEEATVQAINTSGRAVLFAGGTVCIALLGMLVLNLSFLNGVAVAASIVVLSTMAAAVTLLPAMLGLMKAKVFNRRQRRRLEQPRQDEEKTTLAARWSALVERRPKALAAIALIVMVAFAIPTMSLRLGFSDQGNSPSATTVRKAYDTLAEGFGPGSNGPLQLVAVPGKSADDSALTSLVAKVRDTEGVAQAVALPPTPEAKVRIVQVIPTTSPQSEETSELITTLREDVIPGAVEGSSLEVYVGGGTAIADDFAEVLSAKLPLFITVVVALGFLLLLLAFRSFVVPATAAAMNLIAVASSFGVLVLIFQWGVGSDLLGVGKGPIEAFLPVVMLSMLFGLSMDYQVFLVSRMHEEWVKGADNTRAVRTGLAETSRVINAAAIIMIAVFGAFILAGERTIAMFGIGLAAAVAIDAFVLRTMLVPALMHLFGASNWWLPSWLDRILPRLTVEGPSPSEPARISPDEDRLVLSGKN
ncbi:MMPL family transporter [Streptomyces sindenensis]|uniref:MMPL family transporter n=1 Tax=Streptomyces sindenensis TaxID=67363 RepID=UPI001E56181C|nr:MMPL family transporter [Streptomyces sindenensis]